MAMNSCIEVCFTIFFIHIAFFFYQTSAQQGLIQFSCSNEIGNYTENSPFAANLNTILTSASSNVNSFGFYNATSGQPGSTDQVNAIAYCRGDVDIDSCRDCLNNVANNLTNVCPNKKEAIGWYNLCMFRYSNKSIIGIMTLNPSYTLSNPQAASNLNEFSQEVNILANNLTSQASNGTSSRKFAAGRSNNPNVQTIYGYMQCTPDITPGDCAFCLNSASRALAVTQVGVGARYETPNCSFRYEIYSFINILSAN